MQQLVLVLKHVDAQINLDLHQFLKSDPIKKLEPEAKFNSLREHFSEHWGPHSLLDVTKIKQELTVLMILIPVLFKSITSLLMKYKIDSRISKLHCYSSQESLQIYNILYISSYIVRFTLGPF